MSHGIVPKMLLICALWTCAALLPAAPAAAKDTKKEDKEAQRLLNSRETYRELTTMSDASIPRQLQEQCKCVAVFPSVVKGAIGWGGRHGKGVMSCRDSSGKWSPPIFLTLTGGSFGFQIGVESAELVLFFMNERGARSLVESEFTLGGKGSVAAGPVGRTAEADTDIRLNAEIYSYAKTKGLFAGLSLEGAKLGPDNDSTERFYGKRLDPEVVLFQGKVPARPAAMQKFLEVLP